MSPPSRVRWWITWCAVLMAFTLLTSAWGVSRYSMLWLQGHGVLVWLDAGAVKLQYAPYRAQETWHVWSIPRKADFTNWCPQIQGSPGILVVPIWTLMVVAAAPMLVRYVCRQKAARRRQQLGLCRRCGYNLTGNTSGICPECGSAVPGRAENAARISSHGKAG